MTDAEISRRLALAIGWPAKSVSFSILSGACMVNYADRLWRQFDYRDPAIIWPIAERFDCFPYRVSGPLTWYTKAPFANIGEYADTAAKAVALAVIKAKEQK